MSLGNVVRYSTGVFDTRMPWLPDETRLEAFLNDEVPYPSPYPIHIKPGIYSAPDIKVQTKEGSIINMSSIYHAIDSIEMVAERSIEIHLGGIVAAKVISLKARVVKILDEDPKWPIRTTVVAGQKLKIRAEELFIDGADILPPRVYEIKVDYVSYKNGTSNSRWMENVVQKYGEEVEYNDEN